MTYSDGYFTARESWRDWRIEARQLLDLARVSHGTRVLEIGCGGGGLLRLIAERGALGVGVDVWHAALDLAHRRDVPVEYLDPEHRLGPGGHLQLICIGKDEGLPIRSSTFDAVVGQHVIEHLPHAATTILEWKRVLAPGGRLVLATPNAQYPDPAHFADDDHAHIYTQDELCERVEQSGFQVDHCSTIFPFLSRRRALRAAGVIAYGAFRHMPFFDRRGRTILISALNIDA